MTRRNCITCAGKGRVLGLPNAMRIHAPLVPLATSIADIGEKFASIILCPGCKGSRYQFKMPGATEWLPWPQEHIRV